jgi:hypothetical protein
MPAPLRLGESALQGDLPTTSRILAWKLAAINAKGKEVPGFFDSPCISLVWPNAVFLQTLVSTNDSQCPVKPSAQAIVFLSKDADDWTRLIVIYTAWQGVNHEVNN